MSLTFSEKLMIFFQLYLDNKYPDRDLDKDTFAASYRELLFDLRQVIDGKVFEINGLYEGLEVIFKQEGDNNYCFNLGMKGMDRKSFIDFVALIIVHSKYVNDPEYDEVLRKSKYKLKPGYRIEIKIKRGQAI